MSAAHAVAVAVVFVWLGMVVAISFIEAPLKFRAPGVSLQVGLGIGRLVFRALNAAEVALAVPLLMSIPSMVASLGRCKRVFENSGWAGVCLAENRRSRLLVGSVITKSPPRPGAHNAIIADLAMPVVPAPRGGRT